MDTDRLETLSSNVYNENSAAVIRLGYRGLAFVLHTKQNSSSVQLEIPTIGESKTFDQFATRDENMRAMEDFLKNSGGSMISRLQNALARYSPIDPVAGNPGSMQFQMMSQDYDRGMQEGGSYSGSYSGSALGLRLGRFSAGALTQDIYTLPFSYTWSVGETDQNKIIFSMPVSYGSVGGSKSYAVSTGLAYRGAVTPHWTLTPSVAWGVSGSLDLGSLASMVSASLTSNYRFDLPGDASLSVANMVGRFETLKLSSGDFSYDPDIRNTIYRNGLMLNKPLGVAWLGQSLAMEISYVHTQYTGTELYSNKYDEFGIALITEKKVLLDSQLRVGISHMRGEKDIKSTSFTLGVWF